MSANHPTEQTGASGEGSDPLYDVTHPPLNHALYLVAQAEMLNPVTAEKAWLRWEGRARI